MLENKYNLTQTKTELEQFRLTFDKIISSPDYVLLDTEFDKQLEETSSKVSQSYFELINEEDMNFQLKNLVLQDEFEILFKAINSKILEAMTMIITDNLNKGQLNSTETETYIEKKNQYTRMLNTTKIGEKFLQNLEGTQELLSESNQKIEYHQNITKLYQELCIDVFNTQIYFTKNILSTLSSDKLLNIEKFKVISNNFTNEFLLSNTTQTYSDQTSKDYTESLQEKLEELKTNISELKTNISELNDEITKSQSTTLYPLNDEKIQIQKHILEELEKIENKINIVKFNSEAKTRQQNTNKKEEEYRDKSEKYQKFQQSYNYINSLGDQVFENPEELRSLGLNIKTLESFMEEPNSIIEFSEKNKQLKKEIAEDIHIQDIDQKSTDWVDRCQKKHQQENSFAEIVDTKKKLGKSHDSTTEYFPE